MDALNTAAFTTVRCNNNKKNFVPYRLLIHKAIMFP